MRNNTAPEVKQKKQASASRTLLISAILCTLILIGLLLILISHLETLQYERHVEQEVESFQELVAVYVTEPQAIEPESSDPIHHERLYQAMESYNRDIFLSGQSELVDAWSYQVEVFNLEAYEYTLDTVGLVSIPAIDVEMPLYLGCSYDNLSKGFAQLSQTSMPIGGENTNCVIAGHRGWKGMPYLRDVDQLETGDSIFLQNPWEVMEYRISEIQLIDPWDVNCLYIQQGRELLTIITCHPYGVGSHRYILICDRYYPEAEPPVFVSPTQGHWEWEWQTSISINAAEHVDQVSSHILGFVADHLAWISGAATFLFLMALTSIRRTLRKKRKKHKYERQ